MTIRPAIALLLSLLNTVDLKSSYDQFARESGLSEWLAERSHIGPESLVSIEDVARAVEFREAIRGVVAANARGDLPSPAALEALARAARRSSLRIRLSATGEASLTPTGTGLDAAIGEVLAGMYTSVVEGTWPRLKTCANPACRKAFYDRSRNRSGVWCEMAACGNRLKARRYRLRHPRSGGLPT